MSEDSLQTSLGCRCRCASDGPLLLCTFHIHIRADVHRLALAKIGAGQTSLDWEGSKLPFSGKSLEPEYPGHLHCGWSYALMLVSIVSKNALQYRGNSQHDAQEFLLWLLDRVHEDLNHAVKQSGQPPLKPPSETNLMPEGPSFPVCSTFVQELFQAQYRSSLTCPHCQKQSNTFDPFLCISLPIPLPHTRPLYVTVVYEGKCSHCMRIGVAVPLSGTVARLREAVSMETKIPTDQVCPFSLRVVSVVGITYLLPQEEQPLCHPTVESLFVNTEDEYIPDAESVRLQRERHHQPQTCTLSQCFQLYTKEERKSAFPKTLSLAPFSSISVGITIHSHGFPYLVMLMVQLAPDDAWRCPHCKQLQQGSITLSLWTLPDVLIVHLKRFRQEGDRRMKLQNMVKFPLTGLDMTPHVVKRSQSSWSLPSHWSPWRRPYGLGRDPEDYIYDLYAVCNHHGTMQGGHYTAFCKNSVDGLWYCFDDSEVQQLSEDEVCTQTAYILFYQRRTAIPSWSANSSVAGSTSSSLCEHWVSRLPGSKQASVTSAASSRRTSLASLSESVEMTGERSEDDGGFSTRPFVRSVQRQSLSSRSSVTSPLAVNENCIRPSWSLSAKLQMRSSSPSRFSGDSPIHTSASTLEKIGEAADDKVSISCFGSLRNLSSFYQDSSDSHSRREHKAVGRAPLAVMEGVFKDESDARRLNSSVVDTQSESSAQGDHLPPVSDPFDNNNQIAYVDQSDSVDSSPVKEAKPPSQPGSLAKKPESTAKRSPSSKGASEAERSLRKGRPVLASQESSLSSTSPSSPVPVKVSTKPSRSRSKADSSSRASGRHSSPAPAPKKESSPKSQDFVSSPSLQKQKSASSLAHAASSTSAKKASGPALGGPFPPGKSRTSDRSLSREGSRQSLVSDRASVTSSSKPNSPRVSQARAGDGRGDGRHVRSSSMASLRSPSMSVKAGLKRDSKSEDKGLSFFKSALRQKETRRSTDLGKTTLLSKKAGGSAVKAVCKSGVGDKAEKGCQPPGSQQPNASAVGKEQLISKDPTSAKHSLLSARRSKSSQLDSGVPSSPGGRQSAEKPSKKLPSSMQTSARPSQKPQ
ncbi:ubiquitin carboxyl-terminal hydrolase 31-like protein [Camelus ferus]|nr:ubiquitin carboxyl-terminal hydrolase 31-like protein [Camelus ferus]